MTETRAWRVRLLAAPFVFLGMFLAHPHPLASELFRSLRAQTQSLGPTVPVRLLPPPVSSPSWQFTLVGSVRELSDGRLLIGDEKENRLLVGDAQSGRLEDVSRTGGGPGEFSQVGRLWSIGHDSTLMADRMAHRWLLLYRARVIATLVSDEPSVAAVRGGLLQGADHRGHVIANVYSRPSSLSVIAPDDSMILVRVHRGSGVRDTVSRTSPEFSTGSVVPASTGGQRGRSVYRIGIDVREQVAVFADGWIAIVHPRPYRAEWCDPTGSCLKGPIQNTGQRQMTDDAKIAYLLETNTATGWPPTTRLAETSGWPEDYPAFVVPPRRLDASAALPSPDGSVIVERLGVSRNAPRRYDIVNRQGIVSAALELPASQRLVGFGREAVYVAMTDESGIQRLRKHPWP